MPETRSTRLAEFLGVVLFALGLMLLISIATYNPHDPAPFFKTGAPSAARSTISLKTEADALTMSWQPFAAFTIPRRFRALTGITAMVLFLPRKRRARSGSRSPHQTVCPCRSSNCARSEPVAPAPKTKIRMAWPKLYHRVQPGIVDPSGIGVGGRTRCRRSAQEALGAQIFVQIRPMDSVATTSNLPIGQLFMRGVHEPRIPGRFYRIANIFAQAYTVNRNSDPCRLQER